MTEQEVQRLRDAGISDAVILELQDEEEKKRGGQATPRPATTDSGLATPDPNTPSQVFQNAQSAGVPTQGQSPGVGQTVMELGAAAAPYAVPAALTGAGLYGAAKVGGWGRELASTARSAVDAMRERTAFEAAREARIANRPGMGGVPAGGQPPVPGQPAYNVPTQSVPSTQSPMSQAAQAARPVAPTAGPAAPSPVAPSQAPVPGQTATQQAGRGILQQGMDYANKVRQLAMERVIQPVAEASPGVARAVVPFARGAAGVTAAVMPGNVGQNYPFPQSGPLKGQEINPKTGAPWTKEELLAYRTQYGA